MSRTVMVWTALALLPQPSVAVQVRAITWALPQVLLATSLKLMLTNPQLSSAVAMPVALVLVSAGHSSNWSAGGVMIGG